MLGVTGPCLGAQAFQCPWDSSGMPLTRAYPHSRLPRGGCRYASFTGERLGATQLVIEHRILSHCPWCPSGSEPSASTVILEQTRSLSQHFTAAPRSPLSNAPSLEAHNASRAIPFSSVCGPAGAAAAPGQQLQVLEGPGRHEAAEPAATQRPGVVSPWPVSKLPSVNSSPP